MMKEQHKIHPYISMMSKGRFIWTRPKPLFVSFLSLIEYRLSAELPHDCCVRSIEYYEIVTLHPSQVKAPKWKPAAGSPHTLHSWFICWEEKKEDK